MCACVCVCVCVHACVCVCVCVCRCVGVSMPALRGPPTRPRPLGTPLVPPRPLPAQRAGLIFLFFLHTGKTSRVAPAQNLRVCVCVCVCVCVVVVVVVCVCAGVRAHAHLNRKP